MNIVYKKLILAFIFAFIIGSVHAQSKNPLADVINAIWSNRIQDIDKYFDSFVPITINNNQANYSHNQAEIVLRDFFDKNPPSNVITGDTGSPDNASKFVIASFTSPNGKYSVYVLMKLKNSNYLIKEIRLNKE